MEFKIIDRVDKLIETINHPASSKEYGRIRVQAFLDTLITKGFDSARFYDIANNIGTGDLLLILSASAGMLNPDNYLGYKIDYKNSTHYRLAPNQYLTAVDCDDDSKTSEEKQWISDLDLKRKCWIDIPLRVGSKFLGLIACSWEGDREDLTKEDKKVLGMVCYQVANFLLPDSDQLEALRTQFRNEVDKAGSAQEVLEVGCRKICHIIGAPVGAIFEYHWGTDELIKIFEYIDPGLSHMAGNFPEAYPCGSFLTGTAWIDEGIWHIVDFDSLKQKKQNLMHTASVDRHNSLLGKVSSILYAKLGKNEKQFLLRIMNRSTNPKLHLVSRHQRIFDFLCSDLSDALDNAVAQRRLNSIRVVANSVLEQVGLSEDVWSKLVASFNEEGFENCAVLCHSSRSSHFVEKRFHGVCFSDPKKAVPGPAPLPWMDEPFYAKVVRYTDPQIVKMTELIKESQDSPFVTQMRANSIENILLFPIKHPNVKGMLFFPLPQKKSSYSSLTVKRLQEEYRSKMGLLATFTDIIGSCIEAGDSHMTAESALNIMGQIGHEVSTPTCMIEQAAIASVNFALGACPQMRERLLIHKSNIVSAIRKVNSSMEVSRMVATEHRGQLQLNFRVVPLCNVLEEAREAIRGEMEGEDQQGIWRQYRITLNPSCKKLQTLVCDPDKLHQVFLNLFRNGMKYSLPPGDGSAIEVTVEGNPQVNWAIVQVKNWGLGIPPEDFERIFRPFYRSEIVDRKKSIGGMGLGLYIVRRIIDAHKGQVFVKYSVPTFKDQRRRLEFPWEGYETIFEVRLPLNLSTGVRMHKWDESHGRR